MSEPLAKSQRAAVCIVSLVAVGLIAGAASAGTQRASSTGLTGTFKLASGTCSAAGASGSYFRMIYPGGTVAKGKFFDNPDSSCTTKTYTPISAGSDGGLKTGTYEASPTPAFDSKGDALVSSIITPTPFSEIKFGLATLPKDPTTGAADPAPSITVEGDKLSGQIEALWAEWNKLYFSQGSNTVTGSYNATTHTYTLTWTSTISGGPFNGFTGYWHLSGTFAAS